MEQACHICTEFGVLILSAFLPVSDFKRHLSSYFSKFTPNDQPVCLCRLGSMTDYTVPWSSPWGPAQHPHQWPLKVRKPPHNSKLSGLMNAGLTAHLNGAYGLHGFPSYSSWSSVRSYETYFSSPPRGEVRVMMWPQKHSSPAHSDSLVALSIGLSARSNPNSSMQRRAGSLGGNDKQWISGRKIMEFNHINISQAHGSFSTGCQAQVRAQLSCETNHLEFTTEPPTRIFWSD